MKSPSPLRGALAVGWLLLVIIAYASTHKPFTAPWVEQTLLSLWRLALVSWALLAAAGLGRRLLPAPAEASPAAWAGIHLALGLGVWGLATFFIGSVLGLSWPVALLLLLGPGLLTRGEMRHWLGGLEQLRAAWGKSTRFGRILALVNSLLLGLTLLKALAPTIGFDALVYHLTLPRYYLQLGRIVPVPALFFWGMPQQMEMLYTLLMKWGGEQAAALLGWGIGVNALALLVLYLAERWDADTGWMAVTSLLAGFSLGWFLPQAYLEGTLLLTGLAFLGALEGWWERQEKRHLTALGWMAGLALGTKYTAGLLALIGLGFILAKHFRARRWLPGLNDGLRFGGLVTLITLPWWLRNALATGNPFYPFFFPAAGVSRYTLAYYHGPAWGEWWWLFTFPWQATVWGVEGKDGFSFSIGPLLLGLSLPALLVGRETRKRLSWRLLLTISGIGLYSWAIASRLSHLLIQTRLFFFIFPAWAGVAGIGWQMLQRWRAGSVRFANLAAALILFFVASNTLETLRDVEGSGALGLALGRISPNDYLRRNLGDYQLAMEAIQSLPAESRVLMLWETRSLACFPRCDPDEVIDRWYEAIHLYPDAEPILQAWRTAGYTHLLLNRAGMLFIRENDRRFPPDAWDKLETLLAALPPPQSIGSEYLLYELGSGP